MKQQTTFFQIKFARILSCFLLILFCSSTFYGQTKEYATWEPSGGRIAPPGVSLLPGAAGVSNMAKAKVGTDVEYAVMTTDRGLGLLGIVVSGGDAFLQLKFPTDRVAGATTYVRVDKPMQSGLNLNLGKLLGLVGSSISSRVYIGAGDAVGAEGTVVSGVVDTKMIVDKDGKYYLAITPEAGKVYNAVRIDLKFPTGVVDLGGSITLNVYNAFTFPETTCGVANYADAGIYSGISVDLLGLLGSDKTLVVNPERAIDSNNAQYSEIGFGGLAVDVGATVKQTFFFNGASATQDYFKVKFAVGGSAVNLNLIGAYEIKAYKGNIEVFSKKLSSGLLQGLDLLTLLENGEPIEIPFGPGVEFDRVSVGINTTVGVGIASNPLRVYSVERYGLGTSPLCKETTPPLVDEGGIHMLGTNKNCATILIGHEYANFPYNAVDGNNGTFAVLEASSGKIAGLGSYSGNIHLGYNTTLNAGTTSYLRVDMGDTGLLSGLLNGSLGGLLGGVLDNVLFGNHYFTIDVYDNPASAPVLSGSSANGFDGKPIKVVQDKFGKYYVAITPGVSYKSVKITEHFPSLVGAEASRTMKVYSLCYSTGSDTCEQSFATFSTSSGITLDLLGLGAAGVIDAQNAIDGNIATASKVSVGAVGIEGSMFQHVQFHGLSSNRDHFRVKMKMQASSTVTASVIGSIIVKAYKGDAEVYSQRLNEKLIPGLDLLGLLSNGEMINLPFAPGVEFDRVAVGLSSLVAANVLANPLEIYSIERFGSTTCIDPELQWDPKTTPPFNAPACGVELGRFENVNFPYEAITDNPANDTYATLTAGAGVAAGLGAYSGFIELKYSGAGAAAHEVSYIRVDSEGNLFNALLGGSLGNVLGGILGSVALGDQYIVVQALDAAGAPIGTAYNSKTGFNTEFAKLVKDKSGRFYLAVTATTPYQGVRIEYHHTALVGASGSSSINVYSMCRETSFDACEQAAFTSWDGNGIALDLLNLTNGGVANPEFAIDTDNSNYSTLNMGVAGVAASVSQKIYFKTKSNITDELRVRLQLASPGVLNLDVFGNTKLIFYNGEQNVKEMTLESGLINNIDLLGLFNSGGIQSFTFAPGVVYDRVELKISSLVAVNTSAPVRLYGMSRLSTACPDPDFLDPTDVFKSPVCADGVEIGNVRAVDDVDFAIDGDYNSYATMRADSGIIFGLGNEESILELKFDTPVTANTTSYLRIGDDAGILESLLSGSIGEIVFGLVNQVALGNNYFVVRAKNGASEVLVGSSKDNFAAANGLMKIVQDKAGRYFVAISPNLVYTSIEIKAFSEAIVGITSQGYNLHVYGMCYETDFSGCEEGFSTSWDGSGLNLGITGAAAYGVIDAFKALNNNNNSDYSTLSLGAISVGGHIQQNVQYNKAVPANTTFRLKMAVGTGTVNVSVFDDIRIIGYKDGSVVYNQPLQTAVLGGVSLGTLFNNGGEHDVVFAMDKEVDEIALRLNSLVNATVAVPDVRLYYIVQDCADPEFVTWKSADKISVQGGEEIEYTIHVRNTGTVNIVGVIIEDMLPTNTTYASGGTFAAGKITFPVLDVAVGETKTVTFKVKVNNDLTGVTEIVNVATVNGVETFPPLTNNPNEPDTTALPGTKTPVDQIKSVVTWKAYDVNGDNIITAVSGGEDVAYHIYVRNTGNQNLTNITISDVLPAGLTWKSGGVHAGGTVTFTIASLAVGATSSALNFVVTVDKDLTGITSIKNIALVKTGPTDPGTESFPPIDNTSPTEPNTTIPGTVLDVTPIHDVEISKVGVSDNAISNAQAQLGNEIVYTITVKNVGNKTLNNLVVTDVLPGALTISSVSLGSYTGNTFNYTIPTLAVGGDATFTITTSVVDLGGGTITEIENIATIKYRNEANTADKTESATHTMLTSCTPILADKITLTPTSLTVCAGVDFTIEASTTLTLTNAVYKWYTNAALTGTPIVGDVLTTRVTQTTTFYVTLEADGHCFTTPAALVTITVMPEAGIPTISTTGGTTSACQGEGITLTATASGADSYQWYKDGTSITGATTTTYSATESGYYFATALNATGCESDESASIEITIHDLPTKPTVTPDSSVEICEGESVKLTASTGDAYRWYKDGVEISEDILQDPTDPGSAVIGTAYADQQFIEVTKSGDYSVKVFNSNGCSSVLSDPTTVTVNPTPKLTVIGNQMIYVATGATITWPTVTSSIGVVTWYYNGVVVPTLPTTIATTGVYTYTAVGVSGSCYSTETIIVNVYDDEGCPPGAVRTYANSQSWGSIITGGVSNGANAVNGNPKSYSTITTGLGLLGIGTTWQTLFFPEKVVAGTPVTIKLGKEYSALVLAGGISVVGVYKDGLGTPFDIGTLKPVQGGLLDLLAADNVIEFTFVPSNASGTKDYDGVRISVGALLSVAQSAKVYGAYITKPGSPSCDPIDSTTNANIIDVLHGVEDIGVGVASATASVTDAWNAVDNDLNSFALISRGVAVLNRATLTAVFKQPTTKGDQLQIILETPANPILSLELIKGYTIQRFMGNQPVGPALDSGSSILDLKLLGLLGGFTDRAKILVAPFDEPYDRVKISYGSVVGLLGNATKIYDISIAPSLDYGAVNGDLTLCTNDSLVFKSIDDCTIYEVYTSETGTEKLATADGLTFKLPVDPAVGEHTFYVQAMRSGCAIGSRQAIKVTFEKCSNDCIISNPMLTNKIKK